MIGVWRQNPASFNYLYNNHVLSAYYAPGSVLGTRVIAGNKRDEVSYLTGFTYCEKTDNKHITQNVSDNFKTC